jgi:hypothetical protein
MMSHVTQHLSLHGTHQKVPELSKGAYGKRKICTIHPRGQQKDALTFQEKLDILATKMGLAYARQTGRQSSPKGHYLRAVRLG